MRTTVSISDELLAAAKRRARERGQTLGECGRPARDQPPPGGGLGHRGHEFYGYDKSNIGDPKIKAVLYE